MDYPMETPINGPTYKLIPTQLNLAGEGEGSASWSCVKVFSSVYVVFVISFFAIWEKLYAS